MSGENMRDGQHPSANDAATEASKEKRDKPLLDGCLPEIPEEFHELQMIKAVHPSLFFDQAVLLKARFDAFVKAGFNEDQALKLVLRWGLKKNLTDS